MAAVHSKGRSSAELRERVEKARKAQKNRYATIPNVNSNAQMTPALVKEYCKLESEGESFWLASIKGNCTKNFKKLLSVFGTPEQVYFTSKAE